MISGPVSGALLSINALSLHAWQWMFLIEGGASLVLCGFVWFWLQSHPREARWLSEEEKDALETAIAELEGGSRGSAFASGLAAISPVPELLDKDSHIVALADVYCGSCRPLANLPHTRPRLPVSLV